MGEDKTFLSTKAERPRELLNQHGGQDGLEAEKDVEEHHFESRDKMTWSGDIQVRWRLYRQ